MARAVEFFKENQNLFTNSRETPEKYNLYVAIDGATTKLEHQYLEVTIGSKELF